MRKMIHVDEDGIETNYYVNDRGVVEATERYQDCEDIIEMNKRMQAGEKQVGDWRLTSQIPLIIIEKWLNEEYERGNIGIKLMDPEFDAIIKKKLRDPDWKWLRTT